MKDEPGGLPELIERIKTLTGETQEQISVKAKYKAKTLTQILSNPPDKHGSAIDRLKLAYADVLKNSTSSEIQDDQSERELPMRAILNLTESNRTVSNAVYNISEGNLKLIALLETKVGGSDEERQLIADTRQSDLLELIAEVGTHSRLWHSKQEALAALSRRFYGKPRGEKVAGTQGR